jgi:hypothetical protein
MKDIKEIERIVADINRSADSMRKNKKKFKDIKTDELPSNIRMMIPGISGSKALEVLFSTRIDVLLDNLLTMAMSGELVNNVEKFLRNEEELKKFLDSLGFEKGSFEGPVSSTVLGTIRDSMNSPEYYSIDSDSKRVAFVYKKLRMKWWSFWNKPDLRKKYERALEAIKQILLIVANVYKNREKILSGLGSIVKD